MKILTGLVATIACAMVLVPVLWLLFDVLLTEPRVYP